MKTFIALVLIVLSGLILSCGGGGGGGSDTENQPLEYTGPTTPAVISDANAKAIAEGAFSGGTAASAFALSATSKNSQTRTFQYVVSQNLYSLSRPFSKASFKIVVDAKNPTATEWLAPLATSNESGTIDGDCGGSASYNLGVDDQTGDFTGSFVFSDYCDAGVTINGSATVDGTIDLVEGEIITMNFTFDKIQSADVVLQGEVGVDNSAYPPTSSTIFNMLLQNTATKKVYKYENYVLTGIEGAVYIAFDLTGTFYDPDNGYVTVGTPVDFLVGIDDEWPLSGEMLCTGANGGQAKLTALNVTTYNISVDSNGDGTFETVLGPFFWTDF